VDVLRERVALVGLDAVGQQAHHGQPLGDGREGDGAERPGLAVLGVDDEGLAGARWRAQAAGCEGGCVGEAHDEPAVGDGGEAQGLGERVDLRAGEGVGQRPVEVHAGREAGGRLGEGCAEARERRGGRGDEAGVEMDRDEQ
jgi:hypothetical protein